MNDQLAPSVDSSLQELEVIFNKKMEILAGLVSDLSHKVGALQSVVEMNGLVDRLTEVEPTEEIWPSACALDITCLPPEIDNLYMCEFTPDGTPYRWTGPGKSIRFIFKIDRGRDRNITFGILGAVSSDVLIGTSILVDGVETNCSMSEFSITGTIPLLAASRKQTEIILVLGNTFSPKVLKGESDTRLLGVTLTEVSVK